MKIKALKLLETSVNIYRSTWPNITQT